MSKANKDSAKGEGIVKKAKAAPRSAKTVAGPAKSGAARPGEKAKSAKTAKTSAAAAAKPSRPAAKKTETKSETWKHAARVKPAVSAPAPAKKPQNPAPGKQAPVFVNAGLAVKTASRKPALGVAPGVMILGRSAAAAKNGGGGKTAERKLSKKELADIENALLEKRERLLAGMRRELAVQRERAESKMADEVDKATDAYDEDLSFEIATANDQELGEIHVALEKIEKGTYGECEICGCTISPSRLKILPSATTCVACRGQEELARRRDDTNLLFSMMNGDDADQETGEM